MFIEQQAQRYFESSIGAKCDVRGLGRPMVYVAVRSWIVRSLLAITFRSYGAEALGGRNRIYKHRAPTEQRTIDFKLGTHFVEQTTSLTRIVCALKIFSNSEFARHNQDA